MTRSQKWNITTLNWQSVCGSGRWLMTATCWKPNRLWFKEQSHKKSSSFKSKPADLLSLADLSHSMSNCHLSSTSLVSRHVITNTSFCTVHSNSHSAMHRTNTLTNPAQTPSRLTAFQYKQSVQRSTTTVKQIRRRDSETEDSFLLQSVGVCFL